MKRCILAVSASTMVLAPLPGLADTPSPIADLVGARAAGGETQLESRGYLHIKTEKGDDRAWSYWWQPNRKECVTVATYDGRFDAITTSPPFDCNQPAKKDSGSTAGAVAAVGVAALGIALLAHSSHHHKDGNHLDESGDAEFDRGYRDGLYSQTYHNYDRSTAYSDGYTRGAEQRRHETSHRNGDHYGSAGYAPSAKVNDLVHARASSADMELERRGFRTVNAYKAGQTAYTIRSNERTGQCVQVAVSDGHVRSISSLGRSACR